MALTAFRARFLGFARSPGDSGAVLRTHPPPDRPCRLTEIDRRQLPRLPIWWSSRRGQLTWCSAYSRRAGLSMKRFIGALRLRGESPYAAVARPSVLRGPGPASLLRMVARTSCGHWHRHLVRPATVTGWHWLGWKPFWRWESRTRPGRPRQPRRALPRPPSAGARAPATAGCPQRATRRWHRR